MLHLENLNIQQGTFSLSANWSVSKGQKLAIIGPSGGGKSTLLASIAGFIPPSRGRILFDGLDITKLAPGDRPLSLLFQEHNLFPHLSVAQNVGLGLRANLKLSAKEWQQVEASLEQVGLPNLSNRRPADLSGGQRQRVALARVLLRDRPILMLDEPFAALGPALKQEMLVLVRRICQDRNLLLIMVTHDPEDAKQIADVTSLVNNGTADIPRTTDAFFAKPTAALNAYLGS